MSDWIQDFAPVLETLLRFAVVLVFVLFLPAVKTYLRNVLVHTRSTSTWYLHLTFYSSNQGNKCIAGILFYEKKDALITKFLRF